MIQARTLHWFALASLLPFLALSQSLAKEPVRARPGHGAARATVDFAELETRQQGPPSVRPKVKPNLPSRGRPLARPVPREGAGARPPLALREPHWRSGGANGGPVEIRDPVTSRGLPAPLSHGAAASAPTTASAEPITAQTTPLPDSPPLTASFEGLLDNGLDGTFNPDTQGAVGPNHLMIAANTEVRIQTRDGGVISTVSLDAFWSRLGASNVFDPRLLYDPYGHRWIMSAQADPLGRNPLVLVGVSRTSDPTGLWNLYSVDLDEDAPRYAEAPNLGFNKNWIVVQADLFNSVDFFYETSDLFVFTKSELYNNGPGHYRVLSLNSTNDASTHVPATTYDPDLETLYVMDNYNGNFEGIGYLETLAITGPIGNETIANVGFHEGPAWEYSFPGYVDSLPQLGLQRKLHAGDARLANVVYREGTLFTAHGIFLPPTGPVRSAIQWWEVTPGGRFPLHVGRIVDPNNLIHYAFPSIAVNRNLEVLIGFNRFRTNQYVSAWYAWRSVTDAPNYLRDNRLLKVGEASYFKTNTLGNNVWGDWSATVIDPLNDTEMWTLQAYAAPRVGGASRWGTWWGRVTPEVDLALSASASASQVPAGANITYTLRVTNLLEAIVEGVVLTNTLPAGASFVSATPSQGSCSQAGNQVVCDLGRMNDLQTATVTIVATPNVVGQASNVARVAARGPEMAPADNVATTVVTVTSSADASVTLSAAPNPVHVGSNLEATIIVGNAGPSAATGVIVTNSLPANVTFLSAVPSVGSFVRTGTNVVWTVGNVGAGTTPTMTITMRPTVGGTLTLRSILRVTSVDPQTANNSATTAVRANALPTLSTVPNTSAPEDTAHTVNFTIGDAETPVTSLGLVVSSSNEALVPNGNLQLTRNGANASLRLTPAPDQFGSTVITRTVTDADGASLTLTFTHVVGAVNDPPTLNALPSMSVGEDSGAHPVSLTGITGGPANEPQAATVSATSSAPGIVPNPTVSAVSGGAATLTLTPAANAFGAAVITVTVNDGGTTNNLVSRTFTVTVNPVNDPPALDQPPTPLNLAEDAGPQTVNLTGIGAGSPNETDTVTITATQTDPTLLSALAVSYSGGSAGFLTFNVIPQAFGSSILTLTVNDHRPSNNIVTRQLTVNVSPVNDLPTLDALGDLTILEDAGPQSVALRHITSGAANENQVLTVTADTSTPALLDSLNVNYTSPNAAGTLTFSTPANAHGAGTITITVRDDGTSNNVVTRPLAVTVTPVNDPPTLNPVDPLTIPEDSPLQTVTLSGITAGAANETAQSIALTATSSDPSLIPHPAVLYTSGQPTGSLRFTPTANAHGTVTITVTATDSGGTAQGGLDTTTRQFPVTVTPVNDPPTITSLLTLTLPEDTTADLAVQVDDLETAPAQLNVSVASTHPALVPPAGLVLSGTGADRVLRITPALNQAGTALLRITVTDGQNASTTSEVTLTVAPVNDPPTADELPPLQVDEDSGTHVVIFRGVSAGPANEPQNLTITAASSAPLIIPAPTVSYTNGQATGVLRFTPAPDASGVAGLTLRFDDGAGSNNVTLRSFEVTVRNLNDPPTITPIADQTMLEDELLAVPFTIADPDDPPANLALSAISFNEELVATADLSFGGAGANRTLILRPLQDQSGAGFIFVTVSDGIETATVMFELLVEPVNDPPTISAISNQEMNEDSSMTIFFSALDTETLEENLSVSVSSPDLNLLPAGSLVLGQTSSNRSLTITPAPNQFGAATIHIAATDGLSNAVRSFTLTVHNVNDGPSMSGIPEASVDEDTPTAALPFTVSDLDDPLANLVLEGSSSHPALVGPGSFSFGGTGANRTVVVRPLTNQFGSAVLTVTVRDAGGLAVSNSFALSVRPVADAPGINDLPDQSTGRNTPATVAFQVSDPETGPASVLVAGNSSNLELIPNSSIVFAGSGAARTVTLTPLSNSVGTATITISVYDPDGLSRSDPFTLTVTNVNDGPSVSTLPDITIDEDTSTGPLPFAISDRETAPESLVLSAQSSHPELVPAANVVFGGAGLSRTVSVTPVANGFGVATISVNVSDGAITTTRVFTVTVLAVNDPPSFDVTSALTIAEDAGLQTIPLSNIGAGLNEGQVVTFTVNSSNPALLPAVHVNYSHPATTGSLTFTPAPNAVGTAVITVTASDGQSQTARSILVTVNPLGDPPALGTVGNLTTPEDTPLVIPVTISDPDTPLMLVSVTALSTNAALIAATNIHISGEGATRTITLVPSPNLTGLTRITLTAHDGSDTASTSFNVTVTAVNDWPTINPLTNRFFNVNPGTISVPLSGISSGAPNEADTLSVTVSNSNPGLFSTQPSITYTSPNATGTLSFRPGTSSTGTSTVFVVVRDNRGSNDLTRESFIVGVKSSGNGYPTISTIANRTTPEDTAVTVPFTIGDSQTPVDSLTLRAISLHPALLPNSNITFGGSGSNRTVTLTPASNASGSAAVILTVMDSAFAGTNRSFTLTVTPANDPPFISGIPAQSTAEDTWSGPIPFLVGDAETAAGDLTVSATSGNTTLVPNANIVLGGSGANRALAITPAPNQTGSALITVTVSDGATPVTSVFTLTVNANEDAPTISGIPAQTISEDSATGALPFTVDDAETPAGSLTLSTASSNPLLVPNSAVVLGGTGANRTVTVTPLANQSGSTTITLTVSDGVFNISTNFIVTVVPVNDRPTIGAIGNVTFTRATPTMTVNFGGLGSGAANENQPLFVSASSSNPALIPHPSVNYTGGSAGSLLITTATSAGGTALVTVTVSDGQPTTSVSSASFTVTVNGAPTITGPAPQVVLEDTTSPAIPFVVGDAETPGVLQVLATAADGTLVPSGNLVVGGTGANRTLTLTPGPNRHGSTTINLVVTDAQGISSGTSFTLLVPPVNDPPTFIVPAELEMPKDSSQQVSVTGIAAGGNETQGLTLTATSSNPSIVPNPVVTYSSPDNTAQLSFTPVTGTTGTVTITVTLRDDGGTVNGGIDTTVRTFPVRVISLPALLQIAKVGSQLAVSWPVAAGDYLLQTATAVGGPWNDVVTLPSVVSGRNVINEAGGEGARYYRLNLRTHNPPLRIGYSGANVSISWRTGAGDYVLQSSPSLTTPQWSDVATAPVVGAGRNVVTEPRGPGARFYRLRRRS